MSEEYAEAPEVDILDSVFDETTTEDQAREAAEGNLLPKGKWEGQIVKATPSKVETEEGNHALEGKVVLRIQTNLYTSEGEKPFFFDVLPGAPVKAVSARTGGTYTRQESQNWGFLVQGTKMYGRPARDVIAYATENRLSYELGKSKAKDGYKAKNTLQGISAPKTGGDAL